MLIPTMNDAEVTREVYEDYHKLKNGITITRLAKEYDKLRRQGNVPRTSCYPQWYEIKTNQKNKWLIQMSKAPSDEKYKGIESSNILFIIPFFNDISLRVIKIMPTGGLSVFNGHVFTRYNERMNLNMGSSIELVKHFFTNNGYFEIGVNEKDGRMFCNASCRDGQLFGEMVNNRTWIVYKTFVNKELMRPEQMEARNGLIDILQKQIEEDINQDVFNKDEFIYKADVMKGILNNI